MCDNSLFTPSFVSCFYFPREERGMPSHPTVCGCFCSGNAFAVVRPPRPLLPTMITTPSVPDVFTHKSHKSFRLPLNFTALHGEPKEVANPHPLMRAKTSRSEHTYDLGDLVQLPVTCLCLSIDNSRLVRIFVAM